MFLLQNFREKQILTKMFWLKSVHNQKVSRTNQKMSRTQKNLFFFGNFEESRRKWKKNNRKDFFSLGPFTRGARMLGEGFQNIRNIFFQFGGASPPLPPKSKEINKTSEKTCSDRFDLSKQVFQIFLIFKKVLGLGGQGGGEAT